MTDSSESKNNREVEPVSPSAVELQPVAPEPEPATESRVTQVVVRRSSSAAWAVAAVLVAGIAAGTFLAYSMLYSLPAKVIDTGGATMSSTVETIARAPERLAIAFKPTVNVTTMVQSGIENVRRESKLVVMTAEVDVEIGKSSEKRVLWDALELGETTVRLRVHDNKVQYYLPLDKFDRENVQYDTVKNVLRVTVPAPVLDTSIIEVQSHPAKVEEQTDVGWGRLRVYSGEFLLDEAKRELRDAVIREGCNPLLQEKARQEAQQAVRELLSEWAPNLREGVALDVQFG